jgi:hypothetical protein
VQRRRPVAGISHRLNRGPPKGPPSKHAVTGQRRNRCERAASRVHAVGQMGRRRFSVNVLTVFTPDSSDYSVDEYSSTRPLPLSSAQTPSLFRRGLGRRPSVQSAAGIPLEPPSVGPEASATRRPSINRPNCMSGLGTVSVAAAAAAPVETAHLQPPHRARALIGRAAHAGEC